MHPTVLVVLDGWGIAPAGPGNAISQSNLPFYNKLLNIYPHGLLEASGEAVGLPRGEDGNTETGHLNIGAGSIVYQDLPRINLSIADGSFFQNPAFISAINHCKQNGSNLHLIGLVGSGGVHSNIEHLFALLQLSKEQSFHRLYVHVITDGRDSPPESSLLYLDQLEHFLTTLGFGTIATVAGRYYAMDRDYRWDRTEKAYLALTRGIGDFGNSPKDIITSHYKKKITDEFIPPSIVLKNGKPAAVIKDSDSVIFFNYRVDRPRQLTNAFVLDDFENCANSVEFDPYMVKYHKKHDLDIAFTQKPFPRGDKLAKLFFVTMTEYSRHVKASSVAYPPCIVTKSMGVVLSGKGLFQLRASESEKERFVTYYFSGQVENLLPGEDRLIVPSPKVATYDLVPQMSAYELTEGIIAKIKEKHFDFTVVNFANADMVAHTGVISAAITACETLDICLKKLVQFILDKDGQIFITADHGNAEEMINPKTGGIDTEHSTYPVPFIAVSKKWEGKSIELPRGMLADIAPTILYSMRIIQPATMTGRNLFENVLD